MGQSCDWSRPCKEKATVVMQLRQYCPKHSKEVWRNKAIYFIGPRPDGLEDLEWDHKINKYAEKLERLQLFHRPEKRAVDK